MWQSLAKWPLDVASADFPSKRRIIIIIVLLNFYLFIFNLCILLVALVQNCSLLQANSKSKTALLGFTILACFPLSSVSQGQDFCACFPSFHPPHHEFFHAVILEFRSAAHPSSLICSFPESLHLHSSLCSSKHSGMCFFSKSTTCTGCSLGSHMLTQGGRASSSSGGMEAAASSGPEGTPCIPGWLFLLQP